MWKRSRSSTVILSAFNDYKEMITNTTCDLENHLQHIDEHLRVVASPDAGNIRKDSLVREEMREEKSSILKCLEICNDVSSHINTIQPGCPVSSTSSRRDNRNINPAPAVSAPQIDSDVGSMSDLTI